MYALAIDFGTSNCTAHVARENEVSPVALEGDSTVLPSVAFTARREVAIAQIEDNEFEKRLRSARAEQARNRLEARPAVDDALVQRAIHDAMRRDATRGGCGSGARVLGSDILLHARQ